MAPDLINMILLASGLGIGNAVGHTPAFYALLGKAFADHCGYHVQPGKDGKPLPTISIDGVIDLRELVPLAQQLNNATTGD